VTAPLYGFAAVVHAEQMAVADGAVGCGQVCDTGCHGPLACVRAEHPHRPEGEPDPDTGDPLPADVAPHAGYTPDGQIVQWTCLPGDHDGLTDEERHLRRAAAHTAARTAATEQLLATCDLAELARRLAPHLAAPTGGTP
jgi:hypothetical protein